MSRAAVSALCFKWIMLNCAASFLLSCASSSIKSDSSNSPPPHSDAVASIEQRYEMAIMDAAVVSPEEIMPLLPIPVSPTVKVISWVTESRIPCKVEVPCTASNGANANDRIWVTLANEVQQTCQQWKLSGDALRERLEQLLGLPMNSPPQYRKVKFVVMEVSRERLERACLGVNNGDVGKPTCTIDVQPSTTPELRNYVQQQMAGSYVINNPKGPGYPFTRLGYTYDWNADAKANHYGASEFLLMPGTQYRVVEQYSTDEYCLVR